jgi:Fic family protein
MIHPFGDSIGRTARLIEFSILLRAGLPDMASQILSNYYNDIRQEYYRRLDLCVRERDLSGFVRYAVLRFRDGLTLQRYIGCHLQRSKFPFSMREISPMILHLYP